MYQAIKHIEHWAFETPWESKYLSSKTWKLDKKVLDQIWKWHVEHKIHLNERETPGHTQVQGRVDFWKPLED